MHLARGVPAAPALLPAVEALDEDLLCDGAAVVGAGAAVLAVSELAAAVAAPFCTPPWWLQAPFPPLELVPSLHVTVVAASAA
ncbi:MAG TPA: hypothetical protein VKC11_13615 [Steroidobacteraceae bacterium]|nr:hypothetical protein [Steroidobacteraceae bacterium]